MSITTKAHTATIGDVLRHAIAIAEANPDHVYVKPNPDSERCYYVWDGCGSCIFGQALIKAGIPIEELATVEHEHHEFDGNTGIREILPALYIDTPAVTMVHLVAAQYEQDRGGRWGGSVLGYLRDALKSLAGPRCSHCGELLVGEDCPNYGSGEAHA